MNYLKLKYREWNENKDGTNVIYSILTWFSTACDKINVANLGVSGSNTKWPSWLWCCLCTHTLFKSKIEHFFSAYPRKVLYGLYIGSPTGHSNQCTFLNSLGALQRSCLYRRVILRIMILPVVGYSFYTWVGLGNACKGLNLAQPGLEPGTSWSHSQVSTSTTRPRRHTMIYSSLGSLL